MLRKMTLALTAALLASAFHPIYVQAHAQNISISVGHEGFNQMADYVVEVEAGHEVTITFTYADGDLAGDNPHQIQVVGPGLDLPTVSLSRDKPTASITFTPTQTGTINIYCIIPCVGMEFMTSGKIKAIAPENSGTPTFLALELTPREDGNALAQAILHDPNGGLAAGALLVFKQRTTFGGEIELGTWVTAADGSAAVAIPSMAGQTLEVSAEFAGGNGVGSTQVTANLTVPGVPAVHPIGALSSATPPPMLALLLVIVLGSIWAVYGTVVFQVFRISKGG
jgi:hypothetical protein